MGLAAAFAPSLLRYLKIGGCRKSPEVMVSILKNAFCLFEIQPGHEMKYYEMI